MKRMKFNLDRPQVDSKSIQARKDFDGLMKNHAIMSKPIYKSPWFFGTVGLATVGLAVTTSVMMYSSSEEMPQDLNVELTDSAPPMVESTVEGLVSLSGGVSKHFDDLAKQTLAYSQEINEEKEEVKEPLKEEVVVNDIPNVVVDKKESELVITEKEDKKTTNFNVLSPTIGGKFNGSISREELFDNKGLTTESDVSVIHFELHLIDGLGGKVFQEEGNQLNEEMKDALNKIEKGETIYFENIKGKTKKGDVVRLNPLRYVLMN